MSRSVRLDRDTSLQRLRTVLEARRLPGTGADVDLPHSDAARRFWSERAWSEYSAVPGMSQTLLAMVREGLSTDAVAAVSTLIRDEVTHTELSRDLADGFGGYIVEVPEGIAFDPMAVAGPSGAPLPFWLVGNGCISETVSLELMQARLKYTRHPRVRATLQSIIKDEATHSRLSWMIAQERIPQLQQWQRDELAEFAEELVETLTRSFGTSGMDDTDRRAARRMRQETSDLGLGACPPDEEDAVLEGTAASIRPRLRALGIPL